MYEETKRKMNMLKSLIIALAMYSKLPVPNIDWDGKKYEVCHVFFSRS